MGTVEAGQKVRITDPDIWTQYYNHLWAKRKLSKSPEWRRIKVDKTPGDLILYAQVIWKRKPDYIIETGTRYGGSALFFGDLLMLAGGKRVFTIDPNRQKHKHLPHPMVEYVAGLSTDMNVVNMVTAKLNGSVMVSLDSDHSASHVSQELEIYSKIVSRGQYLVVEDSWARSGEMPYAPYEAVNKFLQEHKEFRRVHNERQFIFALTRDGWLFRNK